MLSMRTTSWLHAGIQADGGCVCCQADLGVPYASKMDSFDDFVTHAKMSALQLGPTAPAGDALSQNGDASTASTLDLLPKVSQPATERSLVLVDDLPHAQGAVQRKRLVQALGGGLLCTVHMR